MYTVMAKARHRRWWNLAAGVLEVARFVYRFGEFEAVVCCRRRRMMRVRMKRRAAGRKFRTCER